MIIVDSTRSGKRLPDALSKTIPIWCAVINRAVAKMGREPNGCDGKATGTWDTNLYTPHGAVSAQEHHQIEAFLDKWAGDLAVRLISSLWHPSSADGMAVVFLRSASTLLALATPLDHAVDVDIS